MSGNPKGSKWRSTPQAARKRKTVLVTLSDEARARLETMSEGETKSALIERLLMGEYRCPYCDELADSLAPHRADCIFAKKVAKKRPE